MTDLHPVLALAPGVVLREIGGEALLVNLRTETVFALNATAARTAALLAKGVALDKVVDVLVSEYATDLSEVRESVSNLVGLLLSKGLLVQSGSVNR
jgi:hypothetical protein